MRPEPTEAELRLAYAHHCARRPDGWPDTFEEAMADPTLSRLVRITAMHPTRPHRKAPAPQARPVTTGPKREPTFAPTPRIDRKRAAAGERDDD